MRTRVTSKVSDNLSVNLVIFEARFCHNSLALAEIFDGGRCNLNLSDKAAFDHKKTSHAKMAIGSGWVSVELNVVYLADLRLAFSSFR